MHEHFQDTVMILPYSFSCEFLDARQLEALLTEWGQV